jgi:predicted phosphohydrolase
MSTPAVTERQKPNVVLPETTIGFVCISDTHNARPSVPSGDVLIHAGDLTQGGTADELRAALDWISSLPHPIKIVVAGNHDKVLDARYRASELLEAPSVNWESLGIIYLEHAATKITVRGRTFTVFGSPYTPEFGTWAFQYPPAHLVSEPARRIWAAVPLHTDVLITHGPPLGHLDMVGDQSVGCRELLARLQTVKPALHVFGHIHAGKGREILQWGGEQSMHEFTWSRSGLGRLSSWIILAAKGGKQARTTGETLLVNASIQPGRRDAPHNKPEIVNL